MIVERGVIEVRTVTPKQDQGLESDILQTWKSEKRESIAHSKRLDWKRRLGEPRFSAIK